MMIYELKATTQKSYYGKASILENEKVIALKSYNTIVCFIEKETGDFKKSWSGWSSTTAKHVNDFRILQGLNKINKKQWENIPFAGLKEAL